MNYQSNPANRNSARPQDILKGAAAISNYLFGTAKRRREIYYLSERSCLPVFKLGAMICARRSTLETWIKDQERQGVVQ